MSTDIRETLRAAAVIGRECGDTSLVRATGRLLGGRAAPPSFVEAALVVSTDHLPGAILGVLMGFKSGPADVSAALAVETTLSEQRRRFGYLLDTLRFNLLWGESDPQWFILGTLNLFRLLLLARRSGCTRLHFTVEAEHLPGFRTFNAEASL